jgi:hypothetical protein
MQVLSPIEEEDKVGSPEKALIPSRSEKSGL